MKIARISLLLVSLTTVKLLACSSSDVTPANVPDAGGDSATSDGSTDPDTAVPPNLDPLCTVTKTGTAGTVYQGTLLLPEQTLAGEVLIESTESREPTHPMPLLVPPLGPRWQTDVFPVSPVEISR